MVSGALFGRIAGLYQSKERMCYSKTLYLQVSEIIEYFDVKFTGVIILLCHHDFFNGIKRNSHGIIFD